MKFKHPRLLSSLSYIRAAAGVPLVTPCDIAVNEASILDIMLQAHDAAASLLVLPELCLTGYTCADLFAQGLLLNHAREALLRLAEQSKQICPQLVSVVGLPLEYRGNLYNCAAVIGQGQIYGIVPKTFLPTYGEFYEKRWFASGSGVTGEMEIAGSYIPFGTDLLFNLAGTTFGVEICEDLWAPNPPSTALALAGAEILLNLSASDEVIGKHDYLVSLIKQQSARLHAAYCYASAGPGESTTDLVFSAGAMIAESGHMLASTPRFSTCAELALADIDLEALRHDRRFSSSWRDSMSQTHFRHIAITSTGKPRTVEQLMRKIDPTPFVPAGESDRFGRCRDIIAIQSLGLRKRLAATRCRTLVVGVSGGLDSTLALLVARHAFDSLSLSASGIIGVTMPGFGTTGRTYHNATELVKMLGATLKEVNIAQAVRQHFADIGHDEQLHDVTYENSQARERTQILMDIANKHGGMVLGTGDLSELALGWCTYNGDQMSMYGVNASIPKTLVKHLVSYFADTTDNTALSAVLADIIDTPISPELLPASETGDIDQRTEDLVGPYLLHDFVLYHLLRFGFAPSKIYELACGTFEREFDQKEIKHWLRVFYKRFFAQQFKRSCMPDGPKVGSVCLSPRGDWRMPSDASAALWLKECEAL